MRRRHLPCTRDARGREGECPWVLVTEGNVRPPGICRGGVRAEARMHTFVVPQVADLCLWNGCRRIREGRADDKAPRWRRH